ncbi:cap-specific mRNA (nucleoside-2'-O-)-methyltransferase 2-like [Bradysia coprophila]|uniref:cap-specific mRNA (nucleoside-2'-O-)-methyltransferase 2-like n=1 Tax=Bradysia coprophila TaxID=38358 RepID=UPI00187DCBE5|nr:cap-specific mRNA (nucleoside-2'-O-)-methyltransferase 2-like [Bradysia coprophila]
MTPRPGRKRNRKNKGENLQNKKLHKQNENPVVKRKDTVKKSSDNDNQTQNSNDENMHVHGSKNDYLSEESDQTASSDTDDTDNQPNLRNRNLEKLVEELVSKKIHELREKPFECPRKEKRDPGSAIASYLRSEVKAEFVTRAWCKLYECLSDFPIVKVSTKGEFNSVHLCEAPGAFIAALNHFLKLNCPNSKFNWRATSLNPHYVGDSFENAIDDRLIIQTYDQWEFGEDFTGDITRKQNVDQLVARCKEMGEINLVTADGSVDCVDCPNDQENKVHKLNFAEVVAALQILDMGGSFVLKMFTFFELTTISLLYFLVNIFDTVDIFKPVASKQGNSEVYVVCIGYQRNNRNVSYVLEMVNQMPNIEVPMFALDIIPADFIEEVKECAKMFMLLQKKAIQTNIFHFHNPQCNLQHIEQLQYEIKKEFCRLYRIKPISDKMKLLNLKKRSKKGNGNLKTCTAAKDLHVHEKETAAVAISMNQVVHKAD